MHVRYRTSADRSIAEHNIPVRLPSLKVLQVERVHVALLGRARLSLVLGHIGRRHDHERASGTGVHRVYPLCHLYRGDEVWWGGWSGWSGWWDVRAQVSQVQVSNILRSYVNMGIIYTHSTVKLGT